MAQLTSQQVNELADNFLAMAEAIGDYRIRNFHSLTKAQNDELSASTKQVLQYADDLYTLSAILVMDNVQNSLITIKQITGEMKNTYQKLLLVQDALDIAGSAVTFCKAVVSLNPHSIIVATGGLIACLNAVH